MALRPHGGSTMDGQEERSALVADGRVHTQLGKLQPGKYACGVGASSAVSATIVALTCPHCGAIQARARKPRGYEYKCKICMKLFAAKPAAAVAPPPRVRRT